MAYKYFAFISYRHTDIKAAKRLQRLLEHYSLPAILQRQKPDTPRKFRVFRDTEELTSGVLTEELHKKLDESQWLIVICSPNSAQSDYVGQEIAYFRQTGRERKIIPFIISGTPHNKERECFHPQLTLGGLELLGIDVQAEPSRFHFWRFHRAFIRVIAKMLDLSFDDLWNRRRRYIIRLRIIQAVVALALIALLATTLLSRPFDLSIQLAEAGDDQPYSLPLSVDGRDSVRLHLDQGDVRSLPLTSLDKAVAFPNIPGKYRGQQVRVQCEAYGFFPLDTLLTLTDNLTLPLRRDPEVYGHLRYIFIDEATDEPLAGAVIDFGCTKFETTADGLLDAVIPVKYQATSYPISITYRGLRYHLFYDSEGDTLKPKHPDEPDIIYVKK